MAIRDDLSGCMDSREKRGFDRGKNTRVDVFVDVGAAEVYVE